MIIIEQFKNNDLELIEEVVKSAFYTDGMDTDGNDNEFNEWNFVEKVKDDEAFVKELCLVAKTEDEYIGYILLTKANIGSDNGLVLGPLAVVPDHQDSSVGQELVEHAINKAEELGYKWIVVAGGEYYYQFGFENATDYNVTISDDDPENKHLKIIFLQDDKTINEGNIKFADSFYSRNNQLV